MTNEILQNAYSSLVGKLPLNKIGVIFCTSSLTEKGREFEKLADCEVVDVAHAILTALQEKGYGVQLVDLDPSLISDLKQFDWIINLAETIYGFPFADFEIAEQMERLNINFTGSGSESLRACLDKAVTKAKLQKYGVITPVYDVIYAGEVFQTKCSYPVIVKPIHEDGSIGISNKSIAWNAADAEALAEHIHHSYHQAALVEEFIEGRDIAASILGNGDEAVVLPLSEIIYPDATGKKFITFDAKWNSETAEFQTSVAKCPCDVSPQIETAIKQVALQAYQIMGCRDYARVDFRLKGEIPYVLEVNPNPCINPDDAGFVNSGRAAGYPFADLIHQILLNSVKYFCKIQAPSIANDLERLNCEIPDERGS